VQPRRARGLLDGIGNSLPTCAQSFALWRILYHSQIWSVKWEQDTGPQGAAVAKAEDHAGGVVPGNRVLRGQSESAEPSVVRRQLAYIGP
jgi:hypothetical protein